MSLFWNDWVGLAAFGAAFPRRPAADDPEATANERDGYGLLRRLREEQDGGEPGPVSEVRRDPEDDRLFAAFLSCPWI